MQIRLSVVQSRILIFILFTLQIFWPAIHFADESIRCNGSLIDYGELISTVLYKCGEPTDMVEYTTYSTVHQRYIVSKLISQRVLIDEFVIDRNFEHTVPADSPDSAEIDVKALHGELASLSRNNVKDKLQYKNLNIRRKIVNRQYLNTLNSVNVYWEIVQSEVKMKKLVYNPGPTQFIRVLTFRNGMLWKMEFREYGY
jgi:hypothetical protein